MRIALYPALWATTGIITVFTFLGFALEWTATRLIPLQKFLSKKIEGRP